jgi:hypothetical protein
MKRKIFFALLTSCFTMLAYSSNYLTFTAEEDNSSFSISNWGKNNPNVEYSLDDGETWTTLLEGDFMGNNTIILTNKGDKALLRGNNPDGFSKYEDKYTYFKMTGKIAASGSVMSLIDGIGENKTIPSNFCFIRLFYNCPSLTQAPELPATELTENCYEHMFDHCTNLTMAPELPATKLANYCYSAMFMDCSSLSLAPKLPATELAPNCYENMFRSCFNITQAPELPATKLANRCYYSMFNFCINLTKAPKLPATELASGCYLCMFSTCQSLTKAPELPATVLASSCYELMFSGTGLLQAPELPATELADNCYNAMFSGTNLTKAPELPATKLADHCYERMFEVCKKLTEAPKLPAMELANSCYNSMFESCENLQKIKVSFTEWEVSMATLFWVEDVAPTGTFYCPKELPLEYGENRIPEGWTVEYIDEGTDVTEYVSDASFKAWGADGKITYSGATMPVRIYDLGGRLVKEVTSEAQSVVMPQHGTYIVKSGTVSLKVKL